MNGLVGIGVYALERLPDPVAARCLARVVDRLGEAAKRKGGGVAWPTPPRIARSFFGRSFPGGCYNLGVAHGIPAAIALLAASSAAGVAAAKAERLLVPAVAWLRGQALDDRSRGMFPSLVTAGEKASPARTAWCYGDPGIAGTLHCAGRALRRASLRSEGVELARSAAGRSLGEAKVVDAGLCHGAAGLAHLLNRMFQSSGDPELRRAARLWLGRTLELRRSKGGVAGYLAFEPDLGEGASWRADPGFLEGAAGVALVLLAATTDVNPEWDRLLLLSSLRD